jgi:hypothetical protein
MAAYGKLSMDTVSRPLPRPPDLLPHHHCSARTSSSHRATDHIDVEARNRHERTPRQSAATFDGELPLQNPPANSRGFVVLDSRGFVVLDSRESPPNDEESLISSVALGLQALARPLPVSSAAMLSACLAADRREATAGVDRRARHRQRANAAVGVGVPGARAAAAGIERGDALACLAALRLGTAIHGVGRRSLVGRLGGRGYVVSGASRWRAGR